MSKPVKISIQQILDELDGCKTEKQYLKVRKRIEKHVELLHGLISDTIRDWQLDIIKYEKEIERLNPIDITRGC